MKRYFIIIVFYKKQVNPNPKPNLFRRFKAVTKRAFQFVASSISSGFAWDWIKEKIGPLLEWLLNNGPF